MTIRRTQCCVEGGEPAGMMLGFLLARTGSRSWCWKSTATFGATSAATPSIPRP